MPVKRLAVLAAASVLLAPGVRAETLAEENVESRFMLAFQSNAAAIQKRLPPDLEVTAAPSGPAKDANLFAVFYDRILSQDATGKAIPASARRIAVVVAAVKTRDGGKPGFAVLRVFDPNPEGVPGYYKNAVLADVEREMAFQGKALEPGTMKDTWRVKTKSGDAIRVHVEYTRAAPARTPREMLILSTAQSGLYRIYRTDELADLVRSPAANVDHAKKLEYRFAIKDMADLFGKDVRLMAAVANPVQIRKVFVPDQQAQR